MAFKYIPAYAGNYTQNRKAQGGSIKKITIHHMAGDMTIEQLGNLWQTKGRNGSSHYGVQHSNIGQYVKEEDVAWTDSNWNSNITSVTIETANSGGSPNWPVADDTLATLITLVADIAKRNNLGTLVPGKNLTWHNMYTATVCPGPYLQSKMQYIADQANRINNSTPTPAPTPTKATTYNVVVGPMSKGDINAIINAVTPTANKLGIKVQTVEVK